MIEVEIKIKIKGNGAVDTGFKDRLKIGVANETVIFEINGEKYYEKSCLTLEKAPFKLTLADIYIDLLLEKYPEEKEKRIL